MPNAQLDLFGFQCQICDAEFEDTFGLQVFDGKEICDDCWDHLSSPQQLQWMITWSENSCDTNDGVVCEECRGNYYYICEMCEYVLHQDDMTYVDCCGEYLCQECFDEHYTRCYDCGGVIARDDAWWSEDHSEYFCEDHIPRGRGIIRS